jgi:hypothetical protein
MALLNESGKRRALVVFEGDSHFGVGLVILGLLKQALLLDFRLMKALSVYPFWASKRINSIR